MVRQSLASSDFRANCLPSAPPPMSPEYSDNREPLYVMNIIPMLNSDLPQFSVMFSCRAHLVSCREHCTVCITLGIAVTENEEMTQHHFLTFTEVLSLSLFILFIFPTASTLARHSGICVPGHFLTAGVCPYMWGPYHHLHQDFLSEL